MIFWIPHPHTHIHLSPLPPPNPKKTFEKNDDLFFYELFSSNKSSEYFWKGSKFVTKNKTCILKCLASLSIQRLLKLFLLLTKFCICAGEIFRTVYIPIYVGYINYFYSTKNVFWTQDSRFCLYCCIFTLDCVYNNKIANYTPRDFACDDETFYPTLDQATYECCGCAECDGITYYSLEDQYVLRSGPLIEFTQLPDLFSMLRNTNGMLWSNGVRLKKI